MIQVQVKYKKLTFLYISLPSMICKCFKYFLYIYLELHPVVLYFCLKCET